MAHRSPQGYSMSQGSEKRKRTCPLTIRLTPDERATIEAAAERAGLACGSYARRVLLGAPTPRQVRRPPAERRELARLLGELGRVGNNINQVARAMHEIRPVTHRMYADALEQLRPVREAILTALGRGP